MSDTISHLGAETARLNGEHDVLRRSLLARRIRPGVADVAHARGLSSRRLSPISDSVLLSRLLARRSGEAAVVASGTLVLAVTAVPTIEEAPTMNTGEPSPTSVIASSNPSASGALPRIEPVLTASGTRMSSGPSFGPSSGVRQAVIPGAASPGPSSNPVPASSPSARRAIATAVPVASDERVLRSMPGVGVARIPDRASAFDAARSDAHAHAAPRAGDVASLRSTASMPADPDASPIQTVAGDVLRVVSVLPAGQGAEPISLAREAMHASPDEAARTASTHLRPVPRPRELPGPAIAADLQLPPNPVVTDARRQAAIRHRATPRLELNGEPVELEPLTLVATPLQAETNPMAVTAHGAGPALPASSRSAAAPYSRPAAVAAPITPPAREPAEWQTFPDHAGGESRRLAESVSRELARSLRRARERKGIPPWKS